MKRKTERPLPGQTSFTSRKFALVEPEVRKCGECGAVLNRYSRPSICTPCVNKERAEAKRATFGLAELGMTE